MQKVEKNIYVYKEDQRCTMYKDWRLCDAVRDAELRSEEKTGGNKLHLHRFYGRDKGSQVLVHIYIM